MKLTPTGFRVAVVGASSLLGQELINVLEERRFPVSRLAKFETEAEEPELPVLDLQEEIVAVELSSDLKGSEFDFVFLAAPASSASAAASLLSRATAGGSIVIDLVSTGEPAGAESSSEAPTQTLRIPSLERAGLAPPLATPPNPAGNKVFVSAHPAALVLSSLLLRLAAQLKLQSATVHIFTPVSEIGSRAVDELQKQAVSLLSFQKPPQTIFGAQLAFNLLPRMGRTRTSPLVELEKRIRFQLRHFLAERVPAPALRLLQVPVFHSLAFSLFIRTVGSTTVEAVTQALQGEHIQVRKAFQAAPSPVEVAESDEILIDAITREAESNSGIWIWATVDNLRLAAVNAVEIAEGLPGKRAAAGVM
jgi:aspartate-semialdehyde dehydrogenase